jgi:hypothetical protein
VHFDDVFEISSRNVKHGAWDLLFEIGGLNFGSDDLLWLFNSLFQRVPVAFTLLRLWLFCRSEQVLHIVFFHEALGNFFKFLCLQH